MSSVPYFRIEEKLQKYMPYFVAVLAVVMLIAFPMTISNFHTLHKEGNKFV